jgi:hypothetical protein
MVDPQQVPATKQDFLMVLEELKGLRSLISGSEERVMLFAERKMIEAEERTNDFFDRRLGKTDERNAREFENIRGELSETEDRFENQMQSLRAQLAASEERMKRHFDVAIEQAKFELLGAKKDDVEVLKDRVTRLERHTGLVKR